MLRGNSYYEPQRKINLIQIKFHPNGHDEVPPDIVRSNLI